MAELKVFHDRDGKTLTVWFGESRAEHVCEETGDEVVLIKAEAGHVIGFEKLNFHAKGSGPLNVSVETTPA
jgi:hypothetical protein